MEPQQYLSNHYNKIRLIHSGNTTEIWLVKENSTNQEYVLKIIKRIGTPYPQMLKLRQSNLPILHYVAETDNVTYVIEEYLQGMNLQEYFDRYGSLNENTVCQYAMEMCDCLELLHSHHILHRDIKPSNLFLTDDHRMKLIDFDAGRVGKADKDNDTQIIGTPGFASPEQYGFQQTDERTDIYSLGLTLQMLLGYDTYKGFMLPILKRCTEFDPSKRYASARKLRQAIKIRGYFHSWRSKLINATTLVVGICVVCLLIKEGITPATVREMQSESTPTVIETVQPLTQQEGITPKLEEETKQSESVEIPIIETPEAPAVAEEYELPQSSLSATNDVPVQEITIEESPELQTPQRDLTALYEKVSTDEVNINQMPRDILINRLGKEDASLEEQNRAVDEHNRRLELNARVKALMEQLPEDMTPEERNAAHFEFYQQEKRRLNLE